MRVASNNIHFVRASLAGILVDALKLYAQDAGLVHDVLDAVRAFASVTGTSRR